MRRPALFALSFLFLSALIGFNVYTSIQQNGGLVYPLDDAYIHMSISKNFLQHGVWGITRFNFSSTSSSILYTLLLSASFAIFGVSVWVPLIFNWIIAGCIVYLVVSISLKYMNGLTAFLFNLLFILFVPLPGMVMLGMEHTLQIFFCLLFAWQTFRKWKGESVSNFLYALVALLAVLTRYESVFLIGLTGAAWVLVYRNWKQPLILALACALPICLFGWYATAQGGFFFPNSLLAKSRYLDGSMMAYFNELAKKILDNALLFSLVLLPFAYWLIFPVRTISVLRKSPCHLLLLVLAFTFTAHLVLANYGWLFRYEAYLVALLFFGLAITWTEWRSLSVQRGFLSQAIVLLLMLILLFPVLIRVQVLSFTNRAMKNIADQQVQIASFLQSNFPASGVAINDIGAISFFNPDLRIFDMEGLGTLEVIRVKKNLDSNFLHKYVSDHNIQIGVFYPHLYAGKIPSGWKQVGTWELTDNFVTGGSIVGFYSIDPSTRQKMLDGLKAHASRLPPNVIQRLNE